MKTLRIAIPAALLLLVLTIVYYATASSLEITPAGGSEGEYSYQILNQNDAESDPINAQSKSSHYTKRLPKGTYEVNVTQGDKSFIGIVTIASRFGKTKVTANLERERQRAFVGENPDKCMNLLGNTLYSFDCGNFNAAIKTHVPPTPDLPGYIDLETPKAGRLESTTALKSGTGLALFADQTEDAPAAHTVVYAYDPSSPQFTPTDSAVLGNLTDFVTYNMLPYQDGFIVYDPNLSKVLYYSSLHANPVQLVLPQPKTASYVPVGIDTSPSGSIAVTFTDRGESAEGSGAPSNTGAKTPSEVVITTNNQPRHYVFDESYSVAKFCGSNGLCLLDTSGRTLKAGKLEGAQFTPTFSLAGVNSIIGTATGLLAATDTGLLELDPATATGHRALSFGGYKYCGISAAAKGQILCLTDAQNKNVALFLGAAPNTDSIDKKIFELKKNDDVDTVSVHGGLIYLVPNGNTFYDPATGTVHPDPVVQGQINNRILAKVKALGINTPPYTLIITSPID